MRVGLGRPRRPLRVGCVSPVRRYSTRRIVLISCYVGGFRQVDESPVCGTRAVGEFVARVDGQAREQSLSRSAQATLYPSLSSLPLNHADLRPQGHPLGPVHDRKDPPQTEGRRHRDPLIKTSPGARILRSVTYKIQPSPKLDKECAMPTLFHTMIRVRWNDNWLAPYI